MTGESDQTGAQQSDATGREFDVVVYGATGYVGGLLSLIHI